MSLCTGCGRRQLRCAHLWGAQLRHLLATLYFVDDLHVRSHVVFARKLLKAVRTRIYLHVALVRRYIVPAEVADMRVDPQAHLAPVYVVTLFGTEIPDATLTIVDRILARSTAALHFHQRRGRRRVRRRAIGIIIVVIETTPEHVH